MEIRYVYEQHTKENATSGAGKYLFTLPENFKAENDLLLNLETKSVVGSAAVTTGMHTFVGYANLYDSRHISLVVGGNMTEPRTVGSDFCHLKSSDYLTITFDVTIPIEGWEVKEEPDNTGDDVDSDETSQESNLKMWTSEPFSFQRNSTVTLPHDIGGTPDYVQVVLVNKKAQFGYLPGDTVIPALIDSSITFDDKKFTIDFMDKSYVFGTIIRRDREVKTKVRPAGSKWDIIIKALKLNV
jgi:hypothetical protein